MCKLIRELSPGLGQSGFNWGSRTRQHRNLFDASRQFPTSSNIFLFTPICGISGTLYIIHSSVCFEPLILARLIQTGEPWELFKGRAWWCLSERFELLNLNGLPQGSRSPCRILQRPEILQILFICLIRYDHRSLWGGTLSSVLAPQAKPTPEAIRRWAQ